MELLVILLVSFVGFLAVLYIFDTRGDQEVLQERLQRLDSMTGTEAPSMFEEELQKPFAERIIMPVIRKLSEFVSKRSSTDYMSNLRDKLSQAGYPGGLKPQEFMAVQFLVGLVMAILFFSGEFFLLKANIVQCALLALVGFGAGFYMPMRYLAVKTEQRRHQIELQLADVLDLLTVAVEAGLGFDAGLQKCCEKMKGPLPQEFETILREIRMGKGRKEALRDAAKRIGVHDVDVFFSAIIQAEQLGVSLGKVLRVQSDQLRLKRKQKAEEEAMKAPIKMMLPLVGCIFPTIMIVLLGPAVIKAMKIFSNK